jgi:hypothetical protein
MRKLTAMLATLVVFASLMPAALAAGPHYLKLAPGKVQAGKVVRVYGSVGGGCAPGVGAATLYSDAFEGATQDEFAGVPAVYATVRKNSKFSIRIRLSERLRRGAYRVGGRCGGGNFGSARLTVKRHR